MALALAKKDLSEYLKQFQKEYTVVVPQTDGKQSSFKEYEADTVLDLSYESTSTSVKNFFFKPKENLLTIENSKTNETLDDEKILIFGLQLVDAAAQKILDEAFEKPLMDKPYMHRRKNALIVAVEDNFSRHSFSDELDIDTEDVADAIAYDVGDYYVLEPLTKKADKLIKNKFVVGKDLNVEKGNQPDTEKIDIKKMMDFLDKGPEHDIWKDLAKECFACGACAYVCPICHCFDVQDRLDITGEKGERHRCWDSCMLADFSAVAMGENFRPNRHERIHNWYHHKFSRSVKERGKPDCVGCGRCIEHCPAKIKIYETIKKCEELG